MIDGYSSLYLPLTNIVGETEDAYFKRAFL